MPVFNFQPYDPTMPDEDIVYDEGHYPDPTSETETRKQLSWPLAKIKDFINDELFDVDGHIDTANIITASTEKTGLMSNQDKRKLEDLVTAVQELAATVQSMEAKLLPVVSIADAGKVLQVGSSGNWVVESLHLSPGPVGGGNNSTQ